MLNVEQRIYLFKLHELTRNNIPRAMKMFEEEFNQKISRMTVSNYWGGAGFPKNPRGGNHHGFTEDAFRLLHRRTKGNIDDMIEKTGYTDGSLRRLCQRYDLPHVRTPKEKIAQKEYPLFPEDVVDRGYRGRVARR